MPAGPSSHLSTHACSTGDGPGARIGHHCQTSMPTGIRPCRVPTLNQLRYASPRGPVAKPVVGVLGWLILLLAGHVAGAQVAPTTGSQNTSPCSALSRTFP